jgi:hypothetical protein
MPRSIVTTALRLQSMLLQSLIDRVVDEAIEAGKGAVKGKDEREVANIPGRCFESVRGH